MTRSCEATCVSSSDAEETSKAIARAPGNDEERDWAADSVRHARLYK